MSVIIKNALRIPALKSAGKLFGTNSVVNVTKVQASRSIWNLSQSQETFHHKCHKHNFCQCSSLRSVHTRGEKELADFLVEEISAERKLLKSKKLPNEIDGFKIAIEGSEISLIKQNGDEIIEVNFNVNHTVDTDPVEPEIEPTMDKPELGEMKSRPTFEVEIKRGGQTLGFTCSTVSPAQQQGQQEESYNDLFLIDEVVMYDGDWKDSNYSVSGEVLDGTLYDLFMNLLEDKGISNEFVEKLIDFSTSYEHDSYIRMLEGIQRFVSPK
ncbi:complement component 1 Q subcomponent-binding protein, mitochondrial isoform X2 [Halyomorpha halys]|uniref:complement component 1 Q subcomponent-binding protein, mitochondrial isoform X2 n=1 Tax=Halyomorpha halys TaxID=286706 RepID=UPI0006D50652|nr:complement component 1 Q subcomponent-binding protein, mitochondrial isoform X2 [Halyomorpha halys]